MDPGLTQQEDGSWVYLNTVPGATVTGVAGYLLSNQPSANNALVYFGGAWKVWNGAVNVTIIGSAGDDEVDNNFGKITKMTATLQIQH